MVNTKKVIHMQRNPKSQYVFVVLGNVSSAQYDIKTILFEKKLKPKDGVVTLYAPYKELLAAYTDKYYNTDMWGIGFSLEALQKKAEWHDSQQMPSLPDGNLMCCKIWTTLLDFSQFDLRAGEAFYVVPRLKNSEEICLNGYKEDIIAKKKYKQWWCKGLRNDVCFMKNDVEIAEYLKGNYQRFCWRNYKQIDRGTLFPGRKLFDKKEGYSLMNLTPQELHGVSKDDSANVCPTLF